MTSEQGAREGQVGEGSKGERGAGGRFSVQQIKMYDLHDVCSPRVNEGETVDSCVTWMLYKETIRCFPFDYKFPRKQSVNSFQEKYKEKKRNLPLYSAPRPLDGIPNCEITE